jgi:hypothetical protein
VVGDDLGGLCGVGVEGLRRWGTFMCVGFLLCWWYVRVCDVQLGARY